MKNSKINSPGIFGWFFLVLMVFALTSCDPSQAIIIENRTGSNARVKFIFIDSDTLSEFKYFRMAGFGEHDTLIIDLDTTKINGKWLFLFGIGTWERKSDLDRFVSIIELIETETWKSKETFTGKVQIKEFLKNRITGRFDQTIEIILE